MTAAAPQSTNTSPTLVDDDHPIPLSLNAHQHFFVVAGAGSGKTRALKKALAAIDAKTFKQLREQGQSIAVITYTNNAADEIKSRLSAEKLAQVRVSTIHSFVWDLIKPFQRDIKAYLIEKTSEKLDKQRIEEEKKPGKSKKRTQDIARYNRRLEQYQQATRFAYSPDSGTPARGYLAHADVLAMAAEFLNKPVMARVLIQRHPFLLIDECQDADKELSRALIKLANENARHHTVGLFGDMMQQVYPGGLPSFPKANEVWRAYRLPCNYRSGKVIVDLANKMRKTYVRNDSEAQEVGEPKEQGEGLFRLYIVQQDCDPESVETRIKSIREEALRERGLPPVNEANARDLILEHKMAARRSGFINLLEAIGNIEKPAPTKLNDLGPVSAFLFKDLLPLYTHRCSPFAIMNHLRAAKSPLLKNIRLDPTLAARFGAQSALAQVFEQDQPTIGAVLDVAVKHKLLNAPDELLDAEVPSGFEVFTKAMNEGNDSPITALKNLEMREMELLWEYLNDRQPFRTQQGVKGEEFDHIIGVLSDEEAAGPSFQFRNAISENTPSDPKEIEAARRARRILYVTTTRAKSSLFLVWYVPDVHKAKSAANALGWFEADQIQELYS